jgi:hypothetical protein
MSMEAEKISTKYSIDAINRIWFDEVLL